MVLPLVESIHKLLSFVSMYQSAIDTASFKKPFYKIFELWLRWKFSTWFLFYHVNVIIYLHESTISNNSLFALKFVEDPHDTYILVDIHFDTMVSEQYPLIHYYPKYFLIALSDNHLLLGWDGLTYATSTSLTACHLFLLEKSLRHFFKNIQAFLKL